MTTIPTPEECHKDACVNVDQSFARILRRWVGLPLGRFDERYSNHAWLRVAVEFFICHIIKSSSDSTLHEYWCDGADFVEWKVDKFNYFFGGACYISDGQARTEWLAPFELRIEYDQVNEDCPCLVNLRFGHSDPVERFSRKYVAGREHYLSLLAHSLYGGRPDEIIDWAANIHLCPYVMWLPKQRNANASRPKDHPKKHGKI